MFDISNFGKNYFFYFKINCEVFGKIKDECGGKLIEEFIGFRLKMNSLLYDGMEKKMVKGVKKCVIDKYLKY